MNRSHVPARNLPTIASGLFALLVLVMAAPTSALNTASTEPSNAKPGGRPPSEARQLIAAGKYPEAEASARQRLAEVEAASSPRSAQTAEALDDLAEALWRLGKGADPDARAVAARAVGIKEELYGGNDTHVAVSLRLLAILTNQAGDYSEAQSILERVLRINQQAFGPESLEVAGSLDNVATILRHEGDYAAARPLVEQALAIKRRLQGNDDLSTANTEMNLATTLALMGDYASARRMMEDVLAIQEKNYPPDHPALLLSLDNMAELMALAGDFESARPLEERALSQREKKLGPDHFFVALSLMNMGEIELHTGHPTEAIEDMTRALRIREKSLGPDHPLVAQGLDTRGEALLQTGDPQGARADFERALQIANKTLDSRHPDRARSILGLGRATLVLGDRQTAFDRGLEAERVVREHFQGAAQGMSEADALRYAHDGAGGLDVAVSALLSARKGVLPPKSVARAWDQVARSRAMVLDEMATRHRYVTNQSDPEVARCAQALSASRARLAGLLSRLPQSGSLEDYRKQVDRAYEEKESAERALAGVSASFRRQQTRARGGLDEILKSLPERTALLAYVRFEQQGRPTSKSPVPAYAAFVLRAGMTEPLLVPIGPAETIDGLVGIWQREAGADPRSGGDVDEAMARYRTAGESLRREIWDPIAPELTKASILLVVPDGSLNLVNLATLPTADNRFLLEDGPIIHYLSSERDLVPASSGGERRPGLLAIGGVDYDSAAAKDASGSPVSSEAPAPPHVKDEPSGTRSIYRSPGSVCSGLNSMRFPALPATASEIEVIAEVAGKSVAGEGSAGVRTLQGAAADEATFKAVAGSFGSLHLATHAYFAIDRCAGASDQPSDSRKRRADHQASKPSLRALQDPLLLAGLALAGANRRGDPARSADGEDGLLTAEEIASLDLGGVRWAVLSACRTGVGEIRNGEGVLGLRRAFDIAGAGTLIMSLWPVEDEATAEWMKSLYQARAGHLSTAESVRRASLDLLSAQKRTGRSTHPFYWGAFIAAGDWR